MFILFFHLLFILSMTEFYPLTSTSLPKQTADQTSQNLNRGSDTSTQNTAPIPTRSQSALSATLRIAT